MPTTIQALPADGHGHTGAEALGWTEDMGGQCYTQSGVSTLVTTTPCPEDLLRAQAPSPASHGEPQQHLDPGGDAAHGRHGGGPCVGGWRPWGWRGGGGRQRQERGGGGAQQQCLGAVYPPGLRMARHDTLFFERRHSLQAFSGRNEGRNPAPVL